MSSMVKILIEHKYFQNAIITLIILNAIILGLETSTTLMAQYGQYLEMIDDVILDIFILEIGLRLFAYRFHFFKDPWSLFDFAVVGVALLPATETFAALRTLRVLRVLRLLSTVPALRRVIEGLLSAIPGIASVTLVMSIFFYVFAVIGTNLYGATFPDWFGSLGSSMFTLFQIMTLESWSMGIVRPIMQQHPSAWIFFVSYILVTTFTMLNLFIAIIVNAMQFTSEQNKPKQKDSVKTIFVDDLSKIEIQIVDRKDNSVKTQHLKT